MPVLVINADPEFDLPRIARQDGLDLFESKRLKLVDARDHDQDLQRERLWADWPTRLENNRSNLRAEIALFLAAAKTASKIDHIIFFVIDEFAPDNSGKLVSKEFLEEINDKIFAQDRRNDRASLTSSGYANVWMVAYVRTAHTPEDVALRAWLANEPGYVNTIFVSAFGGTTPDRGRSDFLAIRILAETLLKDGVNRRFLQLSTQNAYQATCVIVPDTLPSDSASHFIRAALQRTLTALEERGASGAGSQVISQQAEGLKKLTEELLDRTKENTSNPATLNLEKPDREIRNLLAFVTDRSRLRPVWRDRDNFKPLREKLGAHIEEEQSNIELMRAEWVRVRKDYLKDFAAINAQINETIDGLSGSAISSRGNDVAILQDLIKDVNETIAELKSHALSLRESMAAPAAQTTSQTSAANEAPQEKLLALEFELDHIPQRRAIAFVLIVSLAAALFPFLLQFVISLRNHKLDVLLAILFSVLIVVITLVALFRRQTKLRQAARKLRSAMEDWRKEAFGAFDKAMRYQTYTLAIGWLDSVIDRLQRIKESIRKRGEALEACRNDLGSMVFSSGTGRDLEAAVTESIRRLETADWGTWIMAFLREMAKLDYGAKPATAEFKDDGEILDIPVPGLVESARIVFSTPPKIKGGLRT